MAGHTGDPEQVREAEQAAGTPAAPLRHQRAHGGGVTSTP